MLLATVKGDVHDIGKNIVGVVLQCNGYEVLDLGVMVPAEEVLERARAWDADLVGLSGLITPSLDQMVHVASEMERTRMTQPLLIGGATTSRVHTAVRIEPRYTGATVHVVDASRCVGVARRLLDAGGRAAYAARIREDYETIRRRRGDSARRAPLLSIEEARANRLAADWKGHRPTRPGLAGTRVLSRRRRPIACRPRTRCRRRAARRASSGVVRSRRTRAQDRLDAVLPRMGAQGLLPAILDDDAAGAEARALHRDAVRLLRRIRRERLLAARGVIGLFPANSRGDDILFWESDAARDAGDDPIEVVHCLRQQFSKPGRPNLCLADFVAPLASGVRDYAGAFVVTAGLGADELAARFESGADDYQSILAKALADRLAEAFAERMHERVRREFWGYAPGEALTNEELIAGRYRGIRPGAGLPRPARPHGQAGRLPAARRGRDRRVADRDLRHAARRNRGGDLHRAPRQLLLRGGAGRGRPGGGLRRARRDRSGRGGAPAAAESGRGFPWLTCGPALAGAPRVHARSW